MPYYPLPWRKRYSRGLLQGFSSNHYILWWILPLRTNARVDVYHFSWTLVKWLCLLIEAHNYFIAWTREYTRLDMSCMLILGLQTILGTIMWILTTMSSDVLAVSTWKAHNIEIYLNKYNKCQIKRIRPSLHTDNATWLLYERSCCSLVDVRARLPCGLVDLQPR